jgi:hypothetical protein
MFLYYSCISYLNPNYQQLIIDHNQASWVDHRTQDLNAGKKTDAV